MLAKTGRPTLNASRDSQQGEEVTLVGDSDGEGHSFFFFFNNSSNILTLFWGNKVIYKQILSH